jgi:secondary thiamine-phosphate synthase enzyme
MEQLQIATPAGAALVDITRQVQEAITRVGFVDGLCVLFVPHTTAGLTLNENWDPDVQSDILLTLRDIAPVDPRHRHSEGNSPAHIKSSLFGSSQMLIVEHGQLQLGTWQGLYLAEFDGPRRRTVWLKLMKSPQ